MATYIAEALKDENGNLSGGKAGDQNGLEVVTQLWYRLSSKGVPWDWVARLKQGGDVAQAMAILGMQIADNSHIGYDQSQRETMTNECRKVGWNPSKIQTDCETDCSAMIACILNAVGISVSTAMTTRDEKEQLHNTGMFDFYESSEYLDTGDNLKPGDILHRNGHTAICTQNSSSAQPVPDDSKENEQVGARMYINWSKFESGKEYSDTSGWYINGDKGQAYGRYQFDYRYGLVPFMQFCVEQYQELFSGFQSYISMGVGNSELIANAGLISLFKEYTENHLAEFSKMQNWQMYNQYYLQLRQSVLNNCGYDINNIGPYAVGTAASIAIRNSGYWEANSDIFTGTTGKESEHDWIMLVCARQNAKTGNYDGDRWSTTQLNRTLSDMNPGNGVIQIGQGAFISTNPNNPVNPAGNNAGSVGTPDIKYPNNSTAISGGIASGDVNNLLWCMKHFTNILSL